MDPVIISTAFIFAVIFLIYYLLKPSKFWENRGVNGPVPEFLFGNTKGTLFLKESLGQLTKRLYDEFPNEKMVGFYARKRPILILRDQELIKDVLIKDFSNFANRGIPPTDKAEPLSQHLFFLEPQRWRPLRIKLSPVFTSGKLKDMFYILQECCKHFSSYLEKTIGKEDSVEVRELTAKFTTDVIGSAAFGLEMNALADEDSEFRKMGRKVFTMDIWRILKMHIRQIMPNVYNTLWWLFYDYELNDFFINSVKETMEYRDKENIVRHDFIDVLRDIKANPEQIKGIEITDDLLTAQAFVFFVAGFETSSGTISNAVYELAQSQDIQEKLYTEIKQELEKCNGNVTYESLKNMKYLHRVFQETLRLYPALPILMRQAKEAYTFSGTNVTIPAKQNVWIPVFGIQRDAAIFPDPDKFSPERFEGENGKSRHPMSWIPFGDGPRNCIGERFAVIQTKLGLIEILKTYRIDICEKTVIPYDQERSGLLLRPKDGTWVKFTKRE